MNTKELLTKDEKLRRATTKIFADLVLDRNVSHSDIVLGVYKPIVNPITLIDFERIVEEEKKTRTKKQGNKAT